MSDTATRLRQRSEVSSNGCIVWQGCSVTNGVSPHRYGYISVDGKAARVHRVAYELAQGPIPEGLVIDHLCRNTLCINPEHMEVVSQRENSLRGNACWKSACINGHRLSGSNLRVNKNGHRECWICRRHFRREYKKRRQLREQG